MGRGAMPLAIYVKKFPGKSNIKKRDVSFEALRNSQAIGSNPQLPAIQRKAICPCEGGCPRCTGRTDGITQEAPGSQPAGERLDQVLRSSMETAFGADFGAVRIHDGRQAQRAARLLGAEAFTIGTDIYFAERQHAPRTRYSQRLLAHELAHVVQQVHGAARNIKLSSASKKYPMLWRHPTYTSFCIEEEEDVRARRQPLASNIQTPETGPSMRPPRRRDNSFIENAIRWLQSCTVGRDLLSTLNSGLLSAPRARTLFIRNYRNPGDTCCGMREDWGSMHLGAGQDIPRDFDISITFPPDHYRTPGVPWDDPDLVPYDSLAGVHLGHELVHAWHLSEYRRFHGQESDWVSIGLGRHADQYPYSENRIRCEQGLPLRLWYNNPNEVDRYHRQGFADPECIGSEYQHPRIEESLTDVDYPETMQRQ